MPRNSQGTRWCVTLNNPTEAEAQGFADQARSDGVRYAIIAREVGEQGTPHLQCFFIFKRTKRFNHVRGLLPRAHIEPTRGTSEQARDYCTKDGDFDEYGDFPSSQGKRSDLDDLVEWGEEFLHTQGRGPTSPEIARAHPKTYIRFPRVTRCLKLRASAPKLREGEPRDWQRELHDELLTAPDDRSIMFYVDPTGGSGKTWFQQWFFSQYPDKTQILSVGKRDDLCYAVDETKQVFFFNIPRSGMEFFQYTVVEQIKDRMVFSTKYQSCMKTLAYVPHVVVFTNEYPDMTKMSADRYVIRNP